VSEREREREREREWEKEEEREKESVCVCERMMKERRKKLFMLSGFRLIEG